MTFFPLNWQQSFFPTLPHYCKTKILDFCDFSHLHLLPAEELDATTMSKIANCLEVDAFDAKEYIIREGTVGNTFYIIAKGEVVVTQSVVASTTPVVS